MFCMQVWFDPAHQLVYFHGLLDCVLEPHLYVVSLRRPGEVRRLTNLGLSHSVEMSELSDFVLSTAVSFSFSMSHFVHFAIGYLLTQSMKDKN